MIGDVRPKLADYLAGLVDDTGNVPGHCLSRVLETSLTLRLIELTGADLPGEATGLRRFLDAAPGTPGLSPIEEVILRLGQGDAPSSEVLLAGFRHHTAAPKKELLEVLLHLLGAGGPLPAALTQTGDLTGLHTWKKIERISQKLIVCNALGLPHLIQPREVAEITATQERPGIWEGNILSAIIALFALHSHGQHHQLVDVGLRRVLDAQRSDGGIPFILDWGIGATSLAAVTLAGVDGRRQVLARLAARIVELQQDNGGWTYTSHAVQTDTEDTSYCMQALQAVNPALYNAQINNAQEFYLALQNPDGGFPTYLHGNASEIALTAEACIALAATGKTHAGTIGHSIGRGIDFIISGQQTDGTFELSWSRSHSSAIFRAVRALRLVHQIHADHLAPSATEATHRSVNYLLQTQNGDGGWGHVPNSVSDPVSTAFSLATLATADEPGTTPTLQSGVDYLHLLQRSDGSFESVTDEVGPRPIPYDVPDSSNGFVLMGLNLLASSGRTPHYGSVLAS